MTSSTAPSPDLVWRKSSYSGSAGGECIEVAFNWQKSSYSGSQGGECVEVAAHPDWVHVRDSKMPNGPMVNASPATWKQFVAFAAGRAV